MDAVAYIVAVLLANATAAWFVGPVAIGTLVFGATFTLRDRLHARGRRVVYACIAVAALGSVAMAAAGGAPWRIIAASGVALVLNESVDTEVYARLIRRPWWMRVAGSNAVSIPIDTILFNGIAFLGVLPLPFLAAVCVSDILIKALTSALVGLWSSSSTARAKINATRP